MIPETWGTYRYRAIPVAQPEHRSRWPFPPWSNCSVMAEFTNGVTCDSYARRAGFEARNRCASVLANGTYLLEKYDRQSFWFPPEPYSG